jgi:tetratricopeptide (TPR) repeat protein
MHLGLRVICLATVLVLVGAIAAVLIGQMELHGAGLVLGGGWLILGGACTILSLTLSDDFLHRHSGAAGVAQTRQFLRSGWVGILLGGAWLGLHYLDRWVQATAAETRFQVAYNRGVSAVKAQDWQEAVDAFSEAIRLDPKNVKPYRHRGGAYFRQKKPDFALADFSEVVRLDPDDAHSWYNRGLAYLQKKDDDRALADFGEAIRLDPRYTKAYLARSRAYADKGDEVRARADRQKAAELDPALEQARGGMR